MKIRYRLIISIIAFCAILPFAASAQSTPRISFNELSRYIDFNSSLKEIHELIADGKTIPGDRYYLLTGTINGITVRDSDPAIFWASADFLSAEWINGETIKSYKAQLVFDGAEYSTRLYNRLPRELPEDIIVNNTRGLVLVEFADLQTLANGEVIPVFNVLFYESLE